MSISRILLYTSYPPWWKPLADITTATHRKYAEKWGWDYFADCSDVSGPLSSPWVDQKVAGFAPLRTMIKFPLMEHFMTEAACQKKYDWVIWLDADCVVTNYNREFRFSSDVVMPFDVNGLHPTVFAVRNTPLTRGLIWACKEAGTRMFQQHGWSDIMAWRFFLDTPPYSHLVEYVSAKELCAMPPGVHPMPKDVNNLYAWDEYSWTVHLSALSLEKRIELAKQYAK